MGDGLVCEFAYIRQEETESDEVNRFPFGQTNVDFVKINHFKVALRAILIRTVSGRSSFPIRHSGASSSKTRRAKETC